MLHARTDYQHIQDPKGKIGVDEPVMLFRAKDALAPEVLEAYARLLMARCDDPDMVRCVRDQAQRMRDWQAEHGKQLPDVLPHHIRQGDMTDQERQMSQTAVLAGQRDQVPDPGDTLETVVHRSAGGVSGESLQAGGPVWEGSQTGRYTGSGENPVVTEVPREGGPETLGDHVARSLQQSGEPGPEVNLQPKLTEEHRSLVERFDRTDQKVIRGLPGTEEGGGAVEEQKPLSEGGEKLMGGQPREHVPGVPDQPAGGEAAEEHAETEESEEDKS